MRPSGLGCVAIKLQGCGGLWGGQVPQMIPSARRKQGTPEVEHGDGAGFRPKHAGLFEALPHDVFTARFDNARADKPAVGAIALVIHSVSMVF